MKPYWWFPPKNRVMTCVSIPGRTRLLRIDVMFPESPMGSEMTAEEFRQHVYEMVELAESRIKPPVEGYPYYGGYGRSLLARKAIPKRVRDAIYDRDGHACVTCGTSEKLSIDHIQPWSRGGSDDPSNLQTMCMPCNLRKRDHV